MEEKIDKFLNKWNEELAMWGRVREDTNLLFYTRDDRNKARLYSEAITAIISDFKQTFDIDG